MEITETGRKMDRRTRYTRQIIRDTLLELMGEKGFSHVTVTEVCKRAELNRGTFYLHYLDLNDVLDDIFMELMSETPVLWTMSFVLTSSVPPTRSATRFAAMIGTESCFWMNP